MVIEINQYLVPLTQDKFAIVDADGWEKVKHYKWHYQKRGSAGKNTKHSDGKWSPITIHRFLMGFPSGMVIDHINGNQLDNRYCNLRICTIKENSRNCRKHKKTSSKYKGVSWEKDRLKWSSCIKVDYKNIHLGRYIDEKDAARAYNEAAKKYHGEFARLNIIE